MISSTTSTSPVATFAPHLLDWIALIERLDADDRETLRDHLLALSPEDRRLRFGLPSNDCHIDRYVDGIDFENTFVYGVRRGPHEWLGVGHLIAGPDDAELGLSVQADARGHGLGAAIFRYAVGQASRQGIKRLYMHFLTTNRAILAIARSARMQIGSSGGESDAYLVVPTPDEMVRLLIADRPAPEPSKPC